MKNPPTVTQNHHPPSQVRKAFRPRTVKEMMQALADARDDDTAASSS
ncbi:hypothetical protein ACLK19_15010 [Escherichia coli]